MQWMAVLAAAACLCPDLALASAEPMTAAQLFAVAQEKIAALRFDEAEVIYKALERDPHSDIRLEALYRHGQLLESQRQFADAALLFRAILDEKPDAQRVRLELARVLASMGQESAARRQLLQVQAGGLPPQVAQIVNQYAQALRSAKPLSGSFEIGLAPSSNINRATSSPTLNSILGPLTLSDDAQAKSGLGVNLGGQASAQLPVSSRLVLTAQLASQNTIYRNHAFNDSIFTGSVGATERLGAWRIRLGVGPSYRLYGGHPYSNAVTVTVVAQYMLGTRSQFEMKSDLSRVTYARNALQNGSIFGEILSFDHAFSARLGSKLSLFAQRTTASDPGYATRSAGANVLVWREWGKTTLYGTINASHLIADAQFFLYPDKRKEWLYRAELGATFRHIKFHGFSPVVRVNYESNRSSLDFFTYRRFGGELSITRAF